MPPPFRADGVTPEVLDDFQQRAGRWVATYPTLLDQAGVPRSRLGCKLELRQESSFEEAQAAAEDSPPPITPPTPPRIWRQLRSAATEP